MRLPPVGPFHTLAPRDSVDLTLRRNMSGITSQTSLTSPRARPALALLLALAGTVVVVFSARSLFELSRDSVEETAKLRTRLAEARAVSFDKRVELETALLAYETDSRIKILTAIVQAVGGAALLLGLVYTARNLRATQEKLEIDRQGQLTNRFIQATGQLGAELKGGERNIEVRLGGIYALNRISKDWPKDYWPIAQILTAYVRHNAKWQDPPANVQQNRTEIQAILTVLGHDVPPDDGFSERNKLDLRFADLRGLEFYDAHLEWTDFYGAHLDGAKMWGAVLRHAKLDNAHLAGAILRGAQLQDASLNGADLTGALFDGGTVWPAEFDAQAAGAVFVA